MQWHFLLCLQNLDDIGNSNTREVIIIYTCLVTSCIVDYSLLLSLRWQLVYVLLGGDFSNYSNVCFNKRAFIISDSVFGLSILPCHIRKRILKFFLCMIDCQFYWNFHSAPRYYQCNTLSISLITHLSFISHFSPIVSMCPWCSIDSYRLIDIVNTWWSYDDRKLDLCPQWEFIYRSDDTYFELAPRLLLQMVLLRVPNPIFVVVPPGMFYVNMHANISRMANEWMQTRKLNKRVFCSHIYKNNVSMVFSLNAVDRQRQAF